MPDIIIADTNCFVILSKINKLNLLKELYGTVHTTGDIALEFGQVLPGWIIIRPIADVQKMLVLQTQVDEGEASAIVLALETLNSVVVLDDLKARSLPKVWKLISRVR